MNTQLQLMLQQAIQAFQSGNSARADSIFRKLLQVDPKNVVALHILGVIRAMQSNHQEAIELLQRAIKINPKDASLYYDLAKVFQDAGANHDSLPHHKKAIALAPNNIEASLNYGVSLSRLGLSQEALDIFNQILSIDSNFFEAIVNKTVALKELKQYGEALEFADKALSINSNTAEVWANRAAALNGLQRYDEAIAHHDKALSLKPDYHEAWANKGLTLHELKQYDEAIVHYDKALSLKPDYVEAWSKKGNVLNELNYYDEAIFHFDRALTLNPDIDWMPGYLLHTKMRICSWSGLAESLEDISKKVMSNEKVINPFSLLSLSDDAFLLKRCSDIYAQSTYPANFALGSIPKAAKREKIRIAYFSPDFRNHPVSFLTAELFEMHDRNQFEVFAFSFKKAPIGDEMNLRLRKSFDRFEDVENISDRDIAQLARELQIDIAIDLTGPMQDSRTRIFSYRAAPIQVNWLGYPGTIGADFIDYIVADKTIIPDQCHKFYSEKVVTLPDTYIVDDSKRISSSRVFTRKESGLPENTFVFCCFNNDYKFNPQVLDGWSRILLTAKNSVLWIAKNNERFRMNLITEFEKRGVDPMRIIFAPRVDLMGDHLARYKLADLFLDTHPYNAHTTALDSLKAGIPVLTLKGQSFPSRVAASLLNAIGLPELITNTQAEYEALAIELAMDPQKLIDIKLRLTSNRLKTPLFDTPLFTKNLESAYVKMIERYQADLQPDHIVI